MAQRGIAAICLVFVMALLPWGLFFSQNQRSDQSELLAEFLTQEALSPAFDMECILETVVANETATTPYPTVLAPDAAKLYLAATPAEEYIAAYEYDENQKESDEAELRKFTHEIFEKLAPTFEVSIPDYTVNKIFSVN